MNPSSFSVLDFESHAGAEVCDYAEPLLRDELIVTGEQFTQLLASLGQYDHWHLVYALARCARYDLGAVVPLLPDLLGHTEMSVFCAALNILDNIPAESVTPGLLDRLASVDVDKHWRSAVTSLRERLGARAK